MAIIYNPKRKKSSLPPLTGDLSKTTIIWTPKQIGSWTQRSATFVERAIVYLYNKQTLDKKCFQKSQNPNGIGFSGRDMEQGTFYAKWILAGHELNGSDLIKAREIVNRYTKQITKIANGDI